jgi:hypothetical protein
MSLLSSHLTFAIESLEDLEPELTKTRLELKRLKKCEAKLQAENAALEYCNAKTAHLIRELEEDINRAV